MVSPVTMALRSLPAAAPTRAAAYSSTPVCKQAPLILSSRGSVFPRACRRTSNLRAAAASSSSSASARAVAVDSDQAGAPLPIDQDKPKSYHFLVANAKFMLDEEEHFKELLSERLRNFSERNKQQDFWLVVEPKFLEKFPSITRRLKRPAVALVSTDATWITFMKLRLDRVLGDQFEADKLDEALAYKPVDLQFDKPEKWTAPYPKYEFGWWEPYLPPESCKLHHS